MIANTYHDIGQQKLDAGLRSGQIWGNALASLGQIPGQIQQQKTQDLENQQRQQQLEVGQAQLTGMQQAQAGQQKADQIIAATPRRADGSFDTGALTAAFAQAGVPPAVQQNALKAFDDINGSVTKFHQQRIDAAADLANGALQAHDPGTPWTPDELQLYMATAKTAGMADDDEIKSINQAVANGSDPEHVLKLVRSQGSKYNAPTKFEVAPEGAGALNTATGAITAGTPKPPKTEAELAADAADPNSPTAARSAAALKMLKSGQAAGENEFATFKDASAKKLTGKPDATWADLSPDQQLGVVKQFKTLATDESAIAAADRQTKTIQQQIAQQGRAQDFTESQAGRKELGDKVETPYRDAQEKADILRTVVQAAKNGNMEAAGVQKLLGTLGVVTTEGVKRINGTELEQVGGAGSLWDDIKSRAGKITAGQPLDPTLQDDLVKLAGLLEQSAYKKYSSGFDATTKRYKLTDEQKLPDPSAQFTHQPVPGHPGTFASSTDGGKTWKVDGGG